jgi:TonB-linked SusC/RagA family outer membrane protein
MKKLLLLIVLFVSIGVASLSAQTKVITGTVTATDESAGEMIGVSVTVKGTVIGTITDINGNYSLPNVPNDATTLVFSFIGMKTQEVEIGGRSVVNCVLESEAFGLEEIVVTAMGIKRSEKSIGYAATSVTGSEIAEARSSDVMRSLSGKVAGVKISASSSDPGSSNSVIIRGVSSLSGSNQPLYVIDGVPMNNSSVYSSDGLNSGFDFGNGANAINPDDIETMTVLKGAAATALYGSRAANGVILITSKSGQRTGRGLGIEYNGGMQWESILRFPEFQNEFGMGWNGDHTYIENGSWGPKFDGSMQLWGTVYNNSQKMKPFVALEDNVKDFFDLGVRYNNSLSFNGSNEDGEFYASFSQLSSDGLLPTDADTYDRYTFSTRGSYKIGNLTVSSSINYLTQENQFAMTGQGLTTINSIYQTPRDISIISLADLTDPFNTTDYYFTPYGTTNPYYLLDVVQNTYKSDRTYGKIQLDYTFLEDFNFTYRLGLDASNYEQKSGTPEIKASIGSPNEGQVDQEGEVSQQFLRRRELNSDILLTYAKSVGDFDINALVGNNINDRISSSLSASVTGLDNPTWYNLSNSANTPSVSEYFSNRRLIGVFGQVDLAWKDMLFVTLTARNDWSSTLPTGNNSFFYPGVTGSFLFSELIPDNQILSFGKVRIAYGQTGNDADPYMINPYYAQAAARVGFGSLEFPLGGTNAFTYGNVLGNSNLQPEITTEFEVGANVAFYNGRLVVDFAYYDRNSDKQIFSLDMDPSTGFTAQNLNLGKISNKGVELQATVVPIRTNNFTWEITANYTKNNSLVESLPEELGGVATIYGLTGGTSLDAVVGKPLGMFKAEVPATDPDGNIIVDNSGVPIAADEFAYVGDMNYDYELGLGSVVSYKNLSFSFDFDIRQGGLMYSRTKDINYFVGNAIQTTYNDRNTFIIPNSVQEIDNGDGTYNYVENTIPVASSDITNYFGDGADMLGSQFLVDKSFVKLRSVTLGYSLPSRWINNTFLGDVRISLFGNNLLLWTPASNTYIDPELTSFGNDLEGNYGEYTANPSTRQYGFNLSVKF